MNPPFVAHDGLTTFLMYAPEKAIRMGGDRVFTPRTPYQILPLYPVKRWVELMLQTLEVTGIVVPVSAMKALRTLLADPNLEYTLENFTKESIMATATKNAPKTEAKAPAKSAAPKTEAKAPAKTAAPAEPKKQPAKAAPAEGAGRRGRPSGMDASAKIKKGEVNFNDHVRAGTVRHELMSTIVGGVGKTLGDVLGSALASGHVVKPVDVRFALENKYIAI